MGLLTAADRKMGVEVLPVHRHYLVLAVFNTWWQPTPKFFN